MDGRERLRLYLEQRREAGERELVLDRMTVDDVLRIVGARQGAVSSPMSAPPPAPQAGDPFGGPHAIEPTGGPALDPAITAAGGDWRAILSAAGAAPASASARWPAGISVGEAANELFGGPLSAYQSLDALAQAIAACTSCPLYGTATLPVPGEGSASAHLVCVGEAPGATEDQTGRPFVGQAGKLLDKILAAIQLAREDVFICNVLKHRPPGNRNPLPTEVAACSPYLVRQLELIRPRAIVAFGTFAAQTLLQTPLTIGKLRGAVHRYYGVPLIVTYHPAALLRNPAWKRPTWEDVQYARRILDGTGL